MTKNETITINEIITQRFQSHLYNCIKESNIPAMQLSALAGVLHEQLDDAAVVVGLGECGVE